MEVKIALDTDRYSDLMSGDASVVELVQRASIIALPFVVVAELRSGFAYGRRLAENEDKLTAFLNSPRTIALFPDDSTTRAYAELYAELRRRGAMIPVSDLWIAALVLQHNLILCSRDRHFDLLPRIARM